MRRGRRGKGRPASQPTFSRSTPTSSDRMKAGQDGDEKGCPQDGLYNRGTPVGRDPRNSVYED